MVHQSIEFRKFPEERAWAAAEELQDILEQGCVHMCLKTVKHGLQKALPCICHQ